MKNSNTDDNSKPKGKFKKGDPRINRKGRPRSFDALRELTQQIAHEEAKGKGETVVIADKIVYTSGEPVIVNGHIATVTEMIMRQWASSKDPRLQQAFIQYAYGKVPDIIQGDSDGGALVIKITGELSDNEK
jgi:hypothetical protein